MRLVRIGSNQNEIHLDDGTIVLFSYETPVAAKITGSFGPVLVRTTTRHSVTTSRHVNQWLAGRKSYTVSQDDLNRLAERGTLARETTGETTGENPDR